MTTITWIVISLLLPAQGQAFSEEGGDVTNLVIIYHVIKDLLGPAD
jgi:hypothetical protein